MSIISTSYNFTIAATGTLILHVTDDGTKLGVPIENATFYRCDDAGNTYGDPITSTIDGDATFNYVPFATDGATTVYYKQTASDGEHTFDDALENITLTEETTTIQISNPDAQERTFNLTDKNYENLPIPDATITLSKN